MLFWLTPNPLRLGGAVTDSQLFGFAGGAGPLALSPRNAAGTCFTVKGNVVDQAPCNPNDLNQSFTFGGQAAPAPPAPAAPTTTAASISTTTTAPVVTAAPAPAPGTIPSANPTTPVPVSRAGGVLQPSAAAESHQFDATATRSLTKVSLKAANGQCLFIDPTAGDFRQNLIPISMKDCDGSLNEKFDFITAGKHNNAKGATLIVSSLVCMYSSSPTLFHCAYLLEDEWLC